MQRLKIAVIILNYNSAEHTLRCVESLWTYTSDSENMRVIIVDNDSSSADRQKLNSIPPHRATYIQSERNLGFAGGMMLGAQAAEADYYFFLNNDCELLNDALSILTRFMDTHEEAAICSASMFDGSNRPRSSFGYFPSLWLALLGSGLLRLLQPRRYPSRHRRYQTPLEVQVVTGAAMFVRGTALRQLHGLDIGYFLYCEEEDFARRAHEAGWRAYHVPEAKIRHIGGGSSMEAGLRPALQREYYISLFRYLRLHHSPAYAYLFRLLATVKICRRVLFGKAPYSLLRFVFRGAPENQSLRYRQDQRSLHTDRL